MRFGHRRAVLGIAALAAVLMIGTTANAAPISKCNAAKKKCIGKYIAAVMGCHAKAEGKNIAVDPACLAKATAKITGAGKGCFDKNDAKVGNDCTQTGDAGAQLTAADAFILDVVNDIDPGYPAPTLSKCGAARKKCVGKKAAGLMGCDAKTNKDGVGDPTCAPKIQDKFGGVKGCDTNALIKGTDCQGTATTGSLETKTDNWQTAASAAVDSGGGGPCGNGVLDAGEDCDPGSPGVTCQAGSNTSAAFTCSPTCTCACPTKVTFAGNATATESLLDTGWTGISHRSPIISNGEVTVGLSCTATSRPCGTCNVNGPIANPNAGAGQIDNQRCSNDPSIHCTVGNNAPCIGGGGTCVFYFGSALPLAAGGVTTCVFNTFNGSVTGTANVESGDAVNSAHLTAQVFTGLTIDNPCARCVGDTTINDGVQGGTCSGGTRNGQACDANGAVPGRPDYGQTSLDCPLSSGSQIAALPIDLSNATGPVTKTVTASSPNCSADPTEKCLCDTCNNVNADPCDANSDCPISGGNPGVCGGKRCIGGTNAGAPCASNTACPGGGLCNRPGEPTKPSACLDDTNTVNTLDCSDTAPVDGEGECTQGPVTTSCSVASGHAQRGCTVDADCGGGVGSCESNNRQCFLTGSASGFGKVGTQTLVAVGMADTPMNDVANPVLGAVFCVGPTGSSSVNNVAGLPGPGRVTIKGTATGLP